MEAPRPAGLRPLRADRAEAAVRAFVDQLELPERLSQALLQKLRDSEFGYGGTFEIKREENQPPAIVCSQEVTPFEHVWLLPHTASVTRSTLYKKLEEDTAFREQCMECMRLDGNEGPVSTDRIFNEFWRWASPGPLSLVEPEEPSTREIQWLLESPETLWIPHADDGNVAVWTLSQDLVSLVAGSKPGGPHTVSMLCAVYPLKSGQKLKRDYLPGKRSLQRVARLVTLIGEDRRRWAYPSEHDGLLQVFRCSSPPSVPLLEGRQDQVDHNDARPRLAMTEFAPDIKKVFTDHPVVEDSLEHQAFELVDKFSDSNILFVRHPVTSFYDLGLRMINQFPHEGSLVSRRLALQMIRSMSASRNGKGPEPAGDASSRKPSWYPLTFFLNAEVNQFLVAHKKQQEMSGDSHWLVKPADPGGVNWCLTNDAGTIVRLLEADGCPWVVQKYVHPPLLLGGRKCSLPVLLLVQSMDPLCAYVYRHFYARVAARQYTMNTKDIADPEVHLTGMEQLEEWRGATSSKEEVSKAVERSGERWDKIEDMIIGAIKEMLQTAGKQIGRWPRSRAVYSVDVVIPDGSCGGGMQPQLVGVNFSPDLSVAQRHNPSFCDELFQTLFLEDSPVPSSMIPLHDESPVLDSHP